VELDKEIHKCFTENKFGPNGIPIGGRGKKIIGAISPHAGYQFSGACQAWSFKEVGEADFPDVYIILGTTHVGFPKAALVIDDFETPFGEVKVDEKFARSLIEKGVAVEDKVVHQQEHSIEVQLPFLQFITITDKRDVLIIKIGDNGVEKELDKKIMIICSSDFTHYGIHYGFVPFRLNVEEKLKEFDMAAIKWIKDLDSWSFINYIDETKATICGCYAIAVFIEACKSMGATKVRVEQYYTSGDVTGDWSNSVGYASIVVE